MALVRAKTPGRAAHRLRQRLATRLPMDVITTHYPDADGQVLLNLAFPPAVHAPRSAAPPSETGQTPELFVKLALHRALAQHAGEETDRLDRAVQHLLTHTTRRTPPGSRRTRPDPHPRSSPRMNPTDEQTAAADAFHAGEHLALQAGAGTGKTTTLDPARPHHQTPRPLPRLQPGHRPGRTHPLPRHRAVQDRPRPRLRRRRPPLHPPPERPPPPGLADRPGPRHHQGRSASANATSHKRPSPTPRCAPWPASATPPTRRSPATTSPACAAWKTTTCTPNSPPTSCRSPARPGPTCSTPTTAPSASTTTTT